MKRITIQGQPGCFHETAARCSFPGEQVEILPCDSFDQQFARHGRRPDAAGHRGPSRTPSPAACFPTTSCCGAVRWPSSENTNSASRTYWRHCRGRRPATSARYTRTRSALMQCGDYLKAHPGDESRRTRRHGGSAREIAEQRLRGTAAICGAGAAELYGLEILERGIETNKHNFTRFLLLADRSRTAGFTDPARTNKASLVFSLPHTQGSLSKVLTLLSFTKSTSRKYSRADHRPRVGIPLLRGCHLRRPGALPAGHRSGEAVDQATSASWANTPNVPTRQSDKEQTIKTKNIKP